MTRNRPLTSTAMAVVLGLALGLAPTPPRAAADGSSGWHSPAAAQFSSESARDRVKRLVVVEAERAGVPPALALALAKVSSDFQPLARSRSGAMGVLQIMPETARRELGVSPDELTDPRLNLEVGLDRLRRFHDHLGDWEQALAAYHAGLDPQAQLPRLTSRAFVDAVLQWAERYAAQARLWNELAAREQDWQPARVGIAPPPAPTTAAGTAAAGRAWPHLRIVSRTRPAVAALGRDFVDIETRRRRTQWLIDDFGPRPDARGPGRSGW